MKRLALILSTSLALLFCATHTFANEKTYTINVINKKNTSPIQGKKPTCIQIVNINKNDQFISKKRNITENKITAVENSRFTIKTTIAPRDEQVSTLIVCDFHPGICNISSLDQQSLFGGCRM